MRLLLKLVALAVLVWAAAAAIVFAVDHGGKPVHAGAIVVLSGSRTRLPVGLRLLHEGYAPLLVVSTGGGGALERQVCGTPSAHVRCFAAHPFSTRGEAEEIGRLARQLHLTRVDVVTSQFHIFRAHMLIRRCYHGELQMVGAPQEWWKLPWFAVTETVKLAYDVTFVGSC